jgi:hypothetical protein
MDESLELKKLDRQMVELLVAKELTKLTQEAAIFAVESMGTGKFIIPDIKAWARKIISIVKEHSV